MRTTHSPLARRIALKVGVIFVIISALVLFAVWASLSSVASANIVVDSAEATTSAEQVVEATYQLVSQTITIVMLVTAVALLVMTGIGTTISYRAAQTSLRRVADINEHTRRITTTTLGERLGLTGPSDEIRDLADTIDNTLAQLEEAFAQQERFAANASHELRTPLAVLRTSLESLAMHEPVTSTGEIDRSLRSVLKIEAILHSLMVLAQTRQLPADLRYPVDLSTTMRVAIEEIGKEFENRDITVTIDITPDIYTAGDQTLLLHAVCNVVENTARYTPVGGASLFTLHADGKNAVMTFSNSGETIGLMDAKRLVEPFNRGSSSRLRDTSGTGLGLSIVNSIARQHGGSLQIDPRDEGGLIVTMRLALTETEPSR